MSAVSKRCSSCGAIRNADDLYCGNCGEPISDSTSTFVKVSQGPDSVHSSGTTILASFETTTPGVQDQKVSPTTKLQRPAFMIAAIIISLFDIILLICSFFFPTVSLFFQLGILLSIVIFIFELVHAGYLEQWYWVIVILLLSPLAGILYDIFNSTSPTMNSVWVVGLLLLTPLGGIIYNTFGPTRKSSLAACRRERSSGQASRSVSTCVLDGTGGSDSMEHSRRQKTVGDRDRAGCKHVVAQALHSG